MIVKNYYKNNNFSLYITKEKKSNIKIKVDTLMRASLYELQTYDPINPV